MDNEIVKAHKRMAVIEESVIKEKEDRVISLDT